MSFSQHPLVDLAAGVLQSSGYAIATVELPDLSIDGGPTRVLAAENEYAVATILGADEWASVAQVIGNVSIAFSNWAADKGAAEKQWDLYTVALVGRPFETTAEFDSALQAAADTSFVRKIIRDGVVEAASAVRLALAPFLPLEPPAVLDDRSPLSALADALREAGIAPDVAAAAITTFSETGEISI